VAVAVAVAVAVIVEVEAVTTAEAGALVAEAGEVATAGAGATLVAVAEPVAVGVDFREEAHHILQVEVVQVVPQVELRLLAVQIRPHATTMLVLARNLGRVRDHG